MREVKKEQMELGAVDISKVKIDPKSRDDIPQILRGFQYLYNDIAIREKLFLALEKTIPPMVDRRNGRPGMELWKIFVLGMVRLNLNCDYDRLHELANQHRTIRQMLGHGVFDDEKSYELQTLRDNVHLLTPEVLGEINQIVVTAGHDLLKKKETARLAARTDSFVVKTDVHFPTDINLLFDAVRKSIQLIAMLCRKHELSAWRQYNHNIKTVKRGYRKAQSSKRFSPRNEQKRLAKIQSEHRAYIELSGSFLAKASLTAAAIRTHHNPSVIDMVSLMEIEKFINHGKRQIEQIRRRVLDGEKIPHNEKVFSLFEPHTEWISKGKLGVPVEFGVRVCITEDRGQFILHHKVMWNQTDEKLTIPMAKETKDRYPRLHSMSYDRGFYSKDNKAGLGDILESFSLPKKGKLSKVDEQIQSSDSYIKAKAKHSAVESAINALGVHGLDRCRDHGKKGFERYVALAITARNVQHLGSILQKKAQRLLILRVRRQKLKAA